MYCGDTIFYKAGKKNYLRGNLFFQGESSAQLRKPYGGPGIGACVLLMQGYAAVL